MKPKKSKKLSIQQMDENEILESYDNKSYLHLEEIKDMDHQELTELLQFYELEDDIERYKKAHPFLKKTKEARIEAAPIPLRLWSYFYDKYLWRLSAGGWLILWSAAINSWLDRKLTGPWLDDALENMRDPMMKSWLEEGLPVSHLILGTGLFLLWVGFRLFHSYTESNTNTRWGGSSVYRSRIRIVVVNSAGERLGFFRAFLRSIFRLFPLFILTTFSMQLSKNWRGLHDKIFGAYVLKVADDVTQVEMQEFIRSHY